MLELSYLQMWLPAHWVPTRCGSGAGSPGWNDVPAAIQVFGGSRPGGTLRARGPGLSREPAESLQRDQAARARARCPDFSARTGAALPRIDGGRRTRGAMGASGDLRLLGDAR